MYGLTTKKHLWVFLCLALQACNDKVTQQSEAPNFPVTKPVVINTKTAVDYVAEILAVQNIDIRAKAQGYLERIHVDEGAQVRAGQLLFSINSDVYQEALAKSDAELLMAEAEMNNAELELQNIETLLAENVISSIELEFAKNRLQIAKAKVQQAAADRAQAAYMLSYTKIKAPFDGIINRLPQKRGSLVEEGTLLTTLSQNKEVFAYFDVSEKEYLALMSDLGQNGPGKRQVELILANGLKHTDAGTIETMDGEIDQETGNLAFRARFNNPGGLLKHGASGKVRIERDLPNALVIPQKATFEIQDRMFVYVVNADNTLSVRQIKIESRLPHLYVIAEGVSPKDTIVYEGVQTASDGLAIVPEMRPMKDIMEAFAKR
ncbi:efflux RND transporter periplasmic adaptor subunit [Maribacter sp. 2307ULW6-5]|uniref:efflux RND transporter periplasmic adaptor subunit n=1 Tax=Maribacter sp. 2307ULW6-5 TaxID=3386275 RepID=UPI0039BD29ED